MSSYKASLTPYISHGGRSTPDRCKGRFNDLVLLGMDTNDNYFLKANSISNTLAASALRERFLLFLNCVESKPGQEPTHPYLYDFSH